MRLRMVRLLLQGRYTVGEIAEDCEVRSTWLRNICGRCNVAGEARAGSICSANVQSCIFLRNFLATHHLEADSCRPTSPKSGQQISAKSAYTFRLWAKPSPRFMLSCSQCRERLRRGGAAKACWASRTYRDRRLHPLVERIVQVH